MTSALCKEMLHVPSLNESGTTCTASSLRLHQSSRCHLVACFCGFWQVFYGSAKHSGFFFFSWHAWSQQAKVCCESLWLWLPRSSKCVVGDSSSWKGQPHTKWKQDFWAKLLRIFLLRGGIKRRLLVCVAVQKSWILILSGRKTSTNYRKSLSSFTNIVTSLSPLTNVLLSKKQKSILRLSTCQSSWMLCWSLQLFKGLTFVGFVLCTRHLHDSGLVYPKKTFSMEMKHARTTGWMVPHFLVPGYGKRKQTNKVRIATHPRRWQAPLLSCHQRWVGFTCKNQEIEAENTSKRRRTNRDLWPVARGRTIFVETTISCKLESDAITIRFLFCFHTCVVFIATSLGYLLSHVDGTLHGEPSDAWKSLPGALSNQGYVTFHQAFWQTLWGANRLVYVWPE